jgi:phosphoadenosine phosphosulfate reductase
MLIENTIFGKINKVHNSIERFKAFEPPEGYWLAYSGGKDSIVIKRLAEMAGVKFKAHYSCTSVDPPELVRFIKADKTVSFDIPHKDGKPITMWNLIPKKKIPPTRLMRYCCSELKESQGKGFITVTGVRWAESSNRKNNQDLINIFTKKKENRLLLTMDNDENRRTVESCYRTQKTLLNPIIDWLDEDVWEFIKAENIPYCSLYDEGYKRLGCIGCPIGTTKSREREFERYPKYKSNYIKSFEKMLNQYDTKPEWQSGEEVFDWWLYSDKKTKILENQIEMEEL